MKLPNAYPADWVADCKEVGTGQHALVYLGRYLYRGVIQEKDVLSHNNGRVTFRYQNSRTKQIETLTLSGVAFLWLILQHILPKRLPPHPQPRLSASQQQTDHTGATAQTCRAPPAATTPGDTL